VGELLVRASVYEAKLEGVTDAFKKATPMIRYISQG
jgi:recombination DNA repair RAD52 pathway protein